MPPTLSLIVPTRGRPDPLRRFLDSLAATTSHPAKLEVILVIDHDDPESHSISHPRLPIRHIVGPPGRTMGELNVAGFEASVGAFVMLLNDDVVVQTRGWDAVLLRAASRFPDQIVLVHVNDTLMREHLCTFPLLSRRFCEIVGGICPTTYRRYRIDDHIEDIFNLLAALGERRTVYLPDVIFEHRNAAERPGTERLYEPDPAILAEDAPRFDALFPARKELALRLLEIFEGRIDPALTASREEQLAGITDPFALRTLGRQIVVRAAWWRRHPGLLTQALRAGRRVRNRYRLSGSRGLLRAIGRRLGCVWARD